jgi:hypothetical protein
MLLSSVKVWDIHLAQTFMVLWHIYPNMLYSAIGWPSIRCHTPQHYMSVLLNKFLNTCTVVFFHRGASSSTLTVVHHIVCAKCRCGTIWQPVSWTSHYYHTLAEDVNGCQLLTLSVLTKRHITPRTSKQDQSSKWVTVLNCCPSAPSVHICWITSLWALESCVVYVSSIWVFNEFGILNEKPCKLFLIHTRFI